MSHVTINDEVADAAPGESLLDIARRHGLHIWFVCDGRGLCRTCECRVRSGGDQLSAPSTSECDSLSESRLKEGFRLACQARIESPGPVDVISTAEVLRRHGAAVDLPNLLSELGRFSADFSQQLPGSVLKIIPRLIAQPPSAGGLLHYARDGLRVMARWL